MIVLFILLLKDLPLIQIVFISYRIFQAISFSVWHLALGESGPQSASEVFHLANSGQRIHGWIEVGIGSMAVGPHPQSVL
jgi:hypothetical protein